MVFQSQSSRGGGGERSVNVLRMESEKFFLQWREFEGNVRAAYKTLLSNGDFSDVTLASRDGHMVTFSRHNLSEKI